MSIDPRVKGLNRNFFPSNCSRTHGHQMTLQQFACTLTANSVLWRHTHLFVTTLIHRIITLQGRPVFELPASGKKQLTVRDRVI